MTEKTDELSPLYKKRAKKAQRELEKAARRAKVASLATSRLVKAYREYVPRLRAVDRAVSNNCRNRNI